MTHTNKFDNRDKLQGMRSDQLEQQTWQHESDQQMIDAACKRTSLILDCIPEARPQSFLHLLLPSLLLDIPAL